MSFLDKKEEVIDLVMTKRGRELYADGHFKPDHYEFYDDEIIYDPNFASAGSTEQQNEIIQRIKNALLLHGQSGFNSNNKKYPEVIKALPLGKSSKFSNNKPAWEVQVEEGTISDTVDHTPLEYYDARGVPTTNEKIPQLDIVCTYNISTSGNTIQLWKSSDDFLMDIFENNSDDTNDNFDLEVYKYVYRGDETITNLKQLSFSEEEQGSDFVEHYFIITTDDEALEKVKVKYIDEEKEKTVVDDPCEVLVLKKPTAEPKKEESKPSPVTVVEKTKPAPSTVAKDHQGNIIDWQWLEKNYTPKCFAMNTTSSHPCKSFWECMLKIQSPPGEFAKLPADAQQLHKQKCAALAPAALNSPHAGKLNIGKCDTKFCYEKENK